MKFEIEKVKDGTFTSRMRSANGKIVGNNQQANTKQGAYKNLVANGTIWAGAFGLKVVKFKKHQKKPLLQIDYIPFGEEGEQKCFLSFEVKEINC